MFTNLTGYGPMQWQAQLNAFKAAQNFFVSEPKDYVSAQNKLTFQHKLI